MSISVFSTTSVWNIFRSKKNWAKYDQKCKLVCLQNTRYSCDILMRYELSRQISEPQIPQFYEEFWREIHRQGSEDCSYVETAMGI
jgi:hypothetical protein